MEDGTGLDRLRESQPHDPTGRQRRDTLQVPYSTSHRSTVDDDGISAVSRFSADSSQYDYRSTIPDFNPNFNLDTQYHGNDIGDQGIPLMDMNVDGAGLRKSSYASNSFASTRMEAYSDISKQDLIPHTRSEQICGWLPKALRWPFMMFLFLLTLGLGALVLGLTLLSERENGIGADQGTSIFLFGWRFTPTLIAVIYTLLVMAMVNDIKRTEVFARLSKPESASAASTIFYKPRMFWFDTYDSLKKRRNNGHRNWALFWASLINFFGLLIISPFSAALLSPQQVFVARDATFSKLNPYLSAPLNLTTDDSIFFRTISSVLENTTTSAWLSNEYAVLPFWPSDSDIPLGAVLSDRKGQWTADTTVYQAALNCQVMELKGFSNFSYNETHHFTNKTTWSVTNMTTFVIGSDDGCSLGFATYVATYASGTIWASGGGWWSGAPNYSYPLLWSPGNGTYQGMNSSNPLMLNATKECGDRSMFFFTTPYKYNQTFQAQGHICETNYYQANVPVTMDNGASSSSFDFDKDLYVRTRTAVDTKKWDVSSFETAFLSQNWSSKFQPPDTSSNPALPVRPQIGGPLILVGAQNDFDLIAMINNPNLGAQAQQVKQRFLGEAMQSIFENTGQAQSSIVKGRSAVSERRIVVSLVIGTLLSVMFFWSALMIAMVAWYTRLRSRPLNLARNPTSASAVASMVASEPSTRALFEGLDRSSEEAMLRALDGYHFSLRGGILYAHDFRSMEQKPGYEANTQVSSGDWRPKVLQVGFLLGLVSLLFALLIAMAVLFAKYKYRGIYQNFLVSSVDIKLDNTSLEALAPYSIIPTLLAVGIKLWWSTIDQTFRRLQPYISLARDQKQEPGLSKLSYISSPLGWAALKASKHRHWLLAFIAGCAVLSEIFTVGMSALWDRNPGSRSHLQALTRSMELRTVPSFFSVLPPPGHGYEQSTDTQNAKGTLSNVFGNLLTGWMYSSIIEGTYNSTPSPWTNDDWAFVPLDLSKVPNVAADLSSSVNSTAVGAANNITVNTPAIRGRLECKPMDMSNTSAWLTTLDFTNKTAWNDPNIPADLKKGYELKLGLSWNQSLPDNKYQKWKYWSDSTPYFSFFSEMDRLICCANDTGTLADPGEASIGFWSPPGDSEHGGIVVKWLTGHPYRVQFNDSTDSSHRQSTGTGYLSHYHWVWKDIPKVTALNCTPIFETSTASVTLDLSTSIVQNHTILTPPTPDPAAWAYNFVSLNVSRGVPYSTSMYSGSGYQITPGTYVHNISVSYGYLFHDALLGAANSGMTGSNAMQIDQAENLDDRTFNFRLPGLNVDFPSYTALNLVNGDKSFRHVFKHFVHGEVKGNNGLFINGTWGLQPLHAAIPDDLGPTMVYNPQTTNASYLQNSFNISTTSPETTAIVTTRIEQLDLSPVAVILCLCILALLILTAVVIFASLRIGGGLNVLPRDVETLGSVIGFVYASERLLALSSDKAALPKGGSGELAKMGWFESGGRRRWGVEIVDETQLQGGRSGSSLGSLLKGRGYTQVQSEDTLR
ncbi:hypothetical protein B0J14DRAFT_556608 [Halenospora varia]|nr:hypothetical protein B0J14DRAFT_556608 [Halenospora varia]